MILCGGAGERLWPASQPGRPKPFLALLGPHSGFQTAVLRARPLAQDGGEVLAVAGAAHAGLVQQQLSAIGAEALALLEPEGRNTTAAIAAAAAWVAQRHPDAVLVILPADHHIPDGEAFRAAIAETLSAARDGAIVTLGLRPTSPSTAMGYIRPGLTGDGVRPILAFVEKPPEERARRLVAEGALWNSGIFVATARTLLHEIARHAAEVAAAVGTALHRVIVDDGAVRLGPAFAEAPKIAFDRAVMEHTSRGMVLPAALHWSDLGAWDAVLAASGRDEAGNSVGPEAQVRGATDVLVRAAPGIEVVVAGADRLAVVAEPGMVLVCGLETAQTVGAASIGADAEGRVRAAPGVRVALVGAEAAVVAAPGAVLVRGLSRRPVSRGAPFATLAEAAAWYGDWLEGDALPLWATAGTDPATGGFREALTWEGEPSDPRRRARVQARQAFVFASAAADGLPGPWAMIARDGFSWFDACARRDDGLYAATLTVDGEVADPEARLYEQAFVLLALAALQRLDRSDPAPAAEAEAIAARLTAGFAHPAGGFREAGPHPFQANAHMHLLEAALAWEAEGGAPGWATDMGDSIARLALSSFIDPASGALHEFFDAAWVPLSGEEGLIEPGHQFEWAWLLDRWGASRGEPEARAAARRLFAVGRSAFDPARGVVQDAAWPDFTVRSAAARLWAQTEHLKAALILDERRAALEAANGLAAYLEAPQAGCWRERMAPDGSFLVEPSPATSLYHLYGAVRELARAAAEA